MIFDLQNDALHSPGFIRAALLHFYTPTPSEFCFVFPAMFRLDREELHMANTSYCCKLPLSIAIYLSITGLSLCACVYVFVCFCVCTYACMFLCECDACQGWYMIVRVLRGEVAHERVGRVDTLLLKGTSKQSENTSLLRIDVEDEWLSEVLSFRSNKFHTRTSHTASYGLTSTGSSSFFFGGSNEVIERRFAVSSAWAFPFFFNRFRRPLQRFYRLSRGQ